MTDITEATRVHAPALEQAAENQRPKTSEHREAKLYRYENTDLYQWWSKRTVGVRRDVSPFETPCDVPFVIKTQPPPSSESEREGPEPCPFCGSAVKVSRPISGRHFIRCDGCGVATPFLFDEASAVSAWNTRATRHSTVDGGVLAALTAVRDWDMLCDAFPHDLAMQVRDALLSAAQGLKDEGNQGG